MVMKTYICGGEKYACDKGYIYMPIKIADTLPKSIEVEGNTLILKSSFHASLLCVKNILAEQNKELEQKIIESFCKFASENDISFVKFTGEFRFSEFEERKTILARCEISNLEKFSNQLSKELNIEIPTQPTHITLYTLQSDLGIGLNSFTELEEKSRVIDIPSEVGHNLALS